MVSIEPSVNSRRGEVDDETKPGKGTPALNASSQSSCRIQIDSFSGFCQYVTWECREWRQNEASVFFKFKVSQISISRNWVLIFLKIKFVFSSLD